MSGPLHRARRSDNEIHAGFIPLLDCAPLVMAKELGLDREHGFALKLHREVSWANIRDRVDIGDYQCAHMLAPMPIAASLGLGRATAPVIVPMALNLNGNAITVSNALFQEMCEADAEAALAGGMLAARAIAAVVRRRQTAGREPLSIGIVYPFSCHNYDLRYWLAAAGVDPDNDVNLLVIPPSLTAESLESGRIDASCVGAPWGSVSVASGAGVIVATKSELWSLSPEKVLGVAESWALGNPELLMSLVVALTKAARWLDERSHREEAAIILARGEYVGVPADVLMRPLAGSLDRGGGRAQTSDPDMVVFHRNHANFPWRSHAVWIITQMIRWGHARSPFDIGALAARVYRPDHYRAAARALGIDAPGDDWKMEGAAPGHFFGGETFDPRNALAYLDHSPFRTVSTDLDAFRLANT